MQHEWEMAQKNVKRAQTRQKEQASETCEVSARTECLCSCPLLLKGRQGSAILWPYRVKEASEQVVVRPVNNPRGKEIRVSLDRVRYCPTQLGDEFWPKKGKQSDTQPNPETEPDSELLSTGVWAGRLRNRSGTP